VAEVAGHQFAYQDSAVFYGRPYVYAITAVDYAGTESAPAYSVRHLTPTPANAYLTQLEPLSAQGPGQPPAVNRSVAGNPLRIAGRRYHRGLGMHAGTEVTYFLGGGYDTFNGEVGIDDGTSGAGQAAFEIYGDDERLFASGTMKGRQQPRPFRVSVRGKRVLRLVVLDVGGEAGQNHADWGDAYLRALGQLRPR